MVIRISALPVIWPTIHKLLCLRMTAPPCQAGAEASAGHKKTPNHPASHLPENSKTF